MCESGRILHHLRNNVQSPKNTVLIVGYQGAHTLGRRIVEREPHLTIFNQKVKLRAQVVVLNGFSGHADRHELERLTAPLAGECRAAFLVHGEDAFTFGQVGAVNEARDALAAEARAPTQEIVG